MKTHDIKILWARSGNICSFPGCEVELVLEQSASRVIGEEAHIKGEKPTSPRYDPNQSTEERESYENHILLCPTHHTVIDADPKEWTVKRLLEIKTEHEQQIITNRGFPNFLNKENNTVEDYKPYKEPEGFLDPVVSEIAEDPRGVKTFRVDASKEDGINTNLKVDSSQRIIFFARGLISYDSGNHFATPEGILCNEYGLPYFERVSNDKISPVVWPHEQAYETDGGMVGRVGSLFGWIGTYSAERAFLIGSKREIEVTSEGILYLAVNDAKGTYGDNDGEFRVDIRILSKGE